MSSSPQTIQAPPTSRTGQATAKAAAAKPVPGWKQLRKLLPYIGRFKSQVFVGLVALALMGIVGTLMPLAFGVIMDCLSGNAQPLGRLADISPRISRVLLYGYHPLSGRT